MQYYHLTFCVLVKNTFRFSAIMLIFTHYILITCTKIIKLIKLRTHNKFTRPNKLHNYTRTITDKYIVIK